MNNYGFRVCDVVTLCLFKFMCKHKNNIKQQINTHLQNLCGRQVTTFSSVKAEISISLQKKIQ